MAMSGWLLALYLACFSPSCVIVCMKRIIVDYSSQNLSCVPHDLGSSTEDLDLSLNHIRNLKSPDFHNTPNLHLLNVSWNELQHIDADTFKTTAALQILDLSHNKLQNLSSQLYLLHTPQLTLLDLSSNAFSIMALGREFVALKRLQWLGLSAARIHNRDFRNMANVTLRTLFINANGTSSYETGSLRSVRAQKAIIVLSNTEVDAKMAADAFRSFKEIKLSNVSSDVRFLQELRGSIRTTGLEVSQIRSRWEVLTGLVNTVLMSSVQRLSLSDVTITSVDKNIDVVLKHTLHLFSITRASVTTFIFNQEELYDFIINVPARNLSVTQTPIVHITCPASVSHIQVLDLSDCALTEKVFSGGTQRECGTLTRVEILILRANNLRHLQPLTSRVHLMDSLRHADFSHNSLTYTQQHGTCVWPPRVTHLDLSSNDLKQNVFMCLPTSVRILKLQNNQITTVPAHLPLLDALSVLDLTANRLLDLPSCVPFPNLQTLLLRSNSLHAPEPESLHTCPHLKTLDASHNPFICTCALRSFTKLVRSEATALVLERWPGAYTCSYPESWSNTTLQDFRPPEVSCNAWLLSAAILVPSVVLALALGLCCVKLDVPWYLKMVWKWTRAKHKALVSQERAEDMQGLRFHAFLSYSQKNAQWVKAQLLPELESGGLRACHHERDFMAGKTILQNILHCIQRSRRCVFVLSSHFVQSQWCHYELYFANHQELSRGSDDIILVLLEPLPSYAIPSKYAQLKSMMSRRTYLQWPPEAAKQKLFWVNLRAALQAELPVVEEREDQT